MGLIVILFFIALIFNHMKPSATRQTFLGFICLVILGLSGYNRVLQYPELGSQSHIHYQLGRIQAFQGIVIKPSTEGRSGLRAVIKIEKIRTKKGWEVASGKLLIYHGINSGVGFMKYGSVIIATSQPKAIQGPKNPNQFNYQQYLASENIYHVAWSDSSSLTEMGRISGNPLLNLTFGIRSHLKKVILRNIQENDNQAIALALLIGDKTEIDPQLRLDYARNGITHILAVSGLHVGILFLVTSSLLRFLKISKSLPAVFIQLCALMFYVLITGWSPSVLRSASMFSAVIIGQSLNRSNSIYNNLSLSAFCLLMANPFYLTELGFQLSYLAVLGIVYYQPKIQSLLIFRPWPLSKIWSLTSLTLSAQILTFPLVIYHFHQFSSFFLITNLIVIPLVTVILCTGFLLLSLGCWPLPAMVIGSLLSKALDFVNLMTREISSLSFSTIENIHISLPQTLVSFLIIACWTLFLSARRFAWILICTILIGLTGLLQFTDVYSWARQKKVVLYSNAHKPLIQLITARKSVILSPNTIANQGEIPLFVSENNLANGLAEGRGFDANDLAYSQTDNWELIVFHGLKILWLKKIWNLNSNHQRSNVDYLILNDCLTKSPKQLTDFFQFKTLVVGSNGKECNPEFVREAKKLNLSVHYLNNEALQIQIE